MRSTVLLPEPLGPSSAVIAPSRAVNETSSTAANVPKRFVSSSTMMGVRHTFFSLSMCRLNVSMPIKITIETAASVSATT